MTASTVPHPALRRAATVAWQILLAAGTFLRPLTWTVVLCGCLVALIRDTTIASGRSVAIGLVILGALGLTAWAHRIVGGDR